MAVKQSVTRCIIFVIVVGFSLLVYLLVCLLFGPCYLAVRRRILERLTHVMDAVLAASLMCDVCCSVVKR